MDHTLSSKGLAMVVVVGNALTAARFVSSKATSHTLHLESVEDAHWTLYTERYYQAPALPIPGRISSFEIYE